jgi:predicted transcriptional regulator
MIKTITNLFINRSDTFAEQSPKGTYTRIQKPLTDKDIQEHLDKKKTIGVYQLNKDNNVKWVCFDFDGERLQDQEQFAKNLFLKLKHTHKVEAILMEFSGKKGYHVWVFTEPVDATSAKIWAEEVSQGGNVHEIFPKQTKIEKEKYGNLVKLPLGIHQVSQKETILYNGKLEPLSLKESKAYLKTIAKKPRTTIPKVIVKEIIRTVVKPQSKTEMPSYIRHLINSGASEGDRHKNAFIITKELYNAGYSKQEIVEHILLFNNNCSIPKPEYIIENHINYLLNFPEKYLTKENITEIPNDQLAAINNIDYQKVIEVYKKWIYMKDTHAIDLAMATTITRKSEQVPLWIIMIAPSGAGKSELIKPFEDMKQPSTTEVMSKITPNTFLSGVSNTKENYIDFAQTLENNPKLFLTYDFAQFVKMDSKDKAQVWAQMRDIYDGFIERKAGLGVSKKVTNLRINWLICSTPVIDSELLVHQELGTRELIYRFDKDDLNKQDLMQRVWDNSMRQKEMRKELAFFVRSFIDKKESEGLKDIKISEETKNHIMLMAKTVSVLRAATESDNYTGELTNFVYEEMPTRILLQLKGVYIGLRNLDDKYSNEMALKVMQRLVLSSIHPIRLRIIIELLAAGTISTTDLQKRINIGYKTIKTQLDTATQLGLVTYTQEEENVDYEGVTRTTKKKNWMATEHEVVQYLKKVRNLKDVWVSLFEKRSYT